MSIYATVPGTLGRDAEIRQTQGGPVCSFSIATEERVKGQKQTTWVRCSLFGKQGEALCQYLTKGAKVTAIGRISMHEYQGKSSFDLAVDNIELQGGKRGASSEPSADPATAGGGFDGYDDAEPGPGDDTSHYGF
jgi:single-strand DNA-binding protein